MQGREWSGVCRHSGYHQAVRTRAYLTSSCASAVQDTCAVVKNASELLKGDMGRFNCKSASAEAYPGPLQHESTKEKKARLDID